MCVCVFIKQKFETMCVESPLNGSIIAYILSPLHNHNSLLVLKMIVIVFIRVFFQVTLLK